MPFHRQKSRIALLTLAAMLAYALLPPGVLASCHCALCECPEVDQVTGDCCCLAGFAPAGNDCCAPVEPAAGDCCQPVCGIGSGCACQPGDATLPARTGEATKVELESPLPLPGVLTAVDGLRPVSGNPVPRTAIAAPPLRILLCVWRN